jgi:uncharacterized membrane protein YbhN (UPF0104 family)
VPTLLAASAGCAFAGLAVFSARVARIAQDLASRLPYPSIQQSGGRLIEAVRRYARHQGELAFVLAMSIAVQVIRVVQAYCLGRAIGITSPVWVYFAFVPVIMLIMQVPVTVQGLGTGQVAFTSLFALVGVPRAQALALSFLYIALGLVGNLPGAFLYASGGSARSQDSRS